MSAAAPVKSGMKSRVKPAMIGVAGILGVLVAVSALAPHLGWDVVRLATGSMAPVFPTDSLVLIHQVDAADVHIGDIVTVSRPNALPVTHRVVAVGASGGSPELTLKGDANRADDPQPYAVSRVGLVVAGLPWGGQVVDAMRTPLGTGSLTVLAALVVLWAWWPEPTRPAHRAAGMARQRGRPSLRADGGIG